MSDRAFLDTNIFVYAAGRDDRRKSRIADKLIDEAIEQGNGVVSYQVVQEFLNVALKKFATPLSAEQARAYISAVFRPMLSVHSSLGLCSEAVDVCFRYKLPWYDSLIVAVALEANCSILFCEDLQHGAKFGGVQIENPFRT